MKIIHTNTLSEDQSREIGALVEACRCADGSRLSFPFAEGTSFYLLRDPGLASVLALVSPEEEIADGGAAVLCSAFTLPSRRQRGYFTALLDEAAAKFPDSDLLFFADRSVPDTVRALESLGAEWKYDEHLMELLLPRRNPLTETPQTAPRGDGRSDSRGMTDDNADSDGDGKTAHTDGDGRNVSPASSRLSLRMEKHGEPDERTDGDGELDFRFFLPSGVRCEADGTDSREADDCRTEASGSDARKTNDYRTEPSEAATVGTATREAGRCRAALFGAKRDAACFYSFAIDAPLRGRGLGGEALALALGELEHRGVRRITLQVSGDNRPALALYKKAGFRITETLSCYLY